MSDVYSSRKYKNVLIFLTVDYFLPVLGVTTCGRLVLGLFKSVSAIKERN